MASSNKKGSNKKKAAPKKAVAKKAAPKKTVTRSRNDNKKMQLIAQMLFVERGFDQKTIHGMTGVSENAISRWKLEGDWETLREQVIAGPDQEMRRMQAMLKNYLDKLEKEKRFPDSAEADAIKKFTSAINDLRGNEVLLMHKYAVGKQFIKYVQDTYGHARTVETVELWTEFIMSV